MTKKNSKLSPCIFADLLERHPDLGMALVPSLIEHAKGGARSTYNRVEAFSLLLILLRKTDAGVQEQMAAHQGKQVKSL